MKKTVDLTENHDYINESYEQLMRERRWTVFRTKKHYVQLTFQIHWRLGKFKWFRFKETVFRYYAISRFYELVLLNYMYTLGVHFGTYDPSCQSGG